jgi:membrane protein involved in colicin uptake
MDLVNDYDDDLLQKLEKQAQAAQAVRVRLEEAAKEEADLMEQMERVKEEQARREEARREEARREEAKREEARLEEARREEARIAKAAAEAKAAEEREAARREKEEEEREAARREKEEEEREAARIEEKDKAAREKAKRDQAKLVRHAEPAAAQRDTDDTARAFQERLRLAPKDKAKLRPVVEMKIRQEARPSLSSNRNMQVTGASRPVKAPRTQKAIEANDESGRLSDGFSEDVIMADAETTVSTSLMASQESSKPF